MQVSRVIKYKKEHVRDGLDDVAADVVEDEDQQHQHQENTGVDDLISDAIRRQVSRPFRVSAADSALATQFPSSIPVRW